MGQSLNTPDAVRDQGKRAGRFGRAIRRRAVGAPSRARLRSAALALAALAALALGAPQQAAVQTEVWTATLTPADLGFGIRGCSNGVVRARCSNTSFLSDDDFTHESTDYAITGLFLRSDGELNFQVGTDFTTEIQAVTLTIGTSSYLLSAGTDSGNRAKTWDTTGLSLTVGTDITVKLVTSTTVTAPDAPTSFAATAGDAAVTLSWAAPASDGGGAITEYEYRYSAGTTVSASATWTDVTDGSDAGDSTADETGVTVSGLTNGTQYAFEVRAVKFR